MEDNKTNPSANLTVTVNNNPPASMVKPMTAIEEMKRDAAEMMADGILSTPQAQDMLEKARPAFVPILAGLKGKLGKDKVRYMLWCDAETGTLVFETMNMDNVEITYKQDPTADDLVLIPPGTDNIDDLLKTLIIRFGPSFM